MSDVIVDKRDQGGGSHVNRGRFMERVKPWVADAVKKAFDSGSITDSHQGGVDVTIPKKGIQEPHFQHGQGGKREYVHPGNDRWTPGDKIPRPRGGGGTGSDPSPDGESEDDFQFHLTGKEFWDAVFEGLELPNLIKTQLTSNIEEYKWVRAGITTAGSPSNIHLLRSYLQSLGRRMVFGKKEKQALLRELEAELETLLAVKNPSHGEAERISTLSEDIAALKKKLKGIPFIDTSDLRYRQYAKEPEPTAKAVMFCVMDISGSMTETRKNIAKLFFILLYRFLKYHYSAVEMVFIKHHTAAEEVDEKTFFESTESGGTIVSTALTLMAEIIKERYGSSDWNIYGAQASDGENWTGNSLTCKVILKENILPLARYFAYVQIEQEKKDELWYQYLNLWEHAGFKEKFAMRFIREQKDIYPVFHELFKQKEKA